MGNPVPGAAPMPSGLPPIPGAKPMGPTGPSDAGMSMKKLIIILLVCMSIIGIPTFMVSNVAMDMYMNSVRGDPNTNFKKWLCLKVGRICRKTLFWGRDSRASEAFKFYCETHKDDPERSKIMYEWAGALEDEGLVALPGDARNEKLDEAVSVLESLKAEYPDGPVTTDVIDRDINRIMYVVPR